ncbi:hypothetical protein Celaphus_00017597, partial [Cervus elaphus hippelaphus]
MHNLPHFELLWQTQALLPELQKAPKHLYGQLKFDTLDCTVQEEHCNMYNIQAYLTAVVFNKSNIHEYGHHSAEQILEIIEDLINSSVISLTLTAFNELVKHKKCKTLTELINVGNIECQQYHSFCAQENVQRQAEINFSQKSNKVNQYHSYNMKKFYKGKTFLVLQREKVVDFYAPRCGSCQNFAPGLEFLARMIKKKKSESWKSRQAYAQTCQKADIRAYPTVKLYPYERAKRNT